MLGPHSRVDDIVELGIKDLLKYKLFEANQNMLRHSLVCN